jgi:hypothetical protein
MTLTSITRLRVRALRFMPGFLLHALQSERQLRHSPGFLGGYVANGPGRAFWTVTAWTDVEAMRAFRRTGAHLKAMPKLLDWCDEAAVATLADSEPAVPEPDLAAARLEAEGRLSKVRHPSAAHAAGALWPDGKLPRRGPTIVPA